VTGTRAAVVRCGRSGRRKKKKPSGGADLPTGARTAGLEAARWARRIGSRDVDVGRGMWDVGLGEASKRLAISNKVHRLISDVVQRGGPGACSAVYCLCSMCRAARAPNPRRRTQPKTRGEDRQDRRRQAATGGDSGG
jgi:hypothetical protein